MDLGYNKQRAANVINISETRANGISMITTYWFHRLGFKDVTSAQRQDFRKSSLNWSAGVIKMDAEQSRRIIGQWTRKHCYWLA